MIRTTKKPPAPAEPPMIARFFVTEWKSSFYNTCGRHYYLITRLKHTARRNMYHKLNITLFFDFSRTVNLKSNIDICCTECILLCSRDWCLCLLLYCQRRKFQNTQSWMKRKAAVLLTKLFFLFLAVSWETVALKTIFTFATIRQLPRKVQTICVSVAVLTIVVNCTFIEI